MVMMTTDWAQATFNSIIVGSSAINCLKIWKGRRERKIYSLVNFYASISSLRNCTDFASEMRHKCSRIDCSQVLGKVVGT